jgi:N-acyl-phosphatidylethanolamine-hydrolysing phospholipase D
MLRSLNFFNPSRFRFGYCSESKTVLTSLVTFFHTSSSHTDNKMPHSFKEDFENVANAVLPTHHRATKSLFQGRFENPWSTWEDRSTLDLFKWVRERRKLGIPTEGYLINNRSPTPQDYAAAFPLETPDKNALANPPEDAIQAFWIGHATVLVQIQGLNFLTDPVFAERCSPLSFAGPKRVVAPALTATSPELPRIDAVLLSHNHYDHLCESSIKALVKRFPDVKFFVPLGVASFFNKRGISNVVEMDWWEDIEFKNMKVTFTPAQHWSSRNGFDRKKTLWGGWAVEGLQNKNNKCLKFWFAGDTGYTPVFKEIGKKLGPFDLAAIPIGAYSPRWFMKVQHIDAQEAVQVAKDVQSRRSMAIHCATFSLTDEPLDEPIVLLKQTLEKLGLPGDEFIALRHGAHISTADGEDLNEPKLIPVPNVPSDYVPAV